MNNQTHQDYRPDENSQQSSAFKSFLLPCCAVGLLALVGAQMAINAQQADDLKAPPVETAKAAASTLPVAEKTDAVVEAANAFLATLSDAQKAAVQIELTPENAARWSNFPAAVVRRNGIFFRDMSPEQAEAALKVARAALSEEGFNRFQEVRATDDAFGASDEAKRGPGGGGPGGGGPGGRRGGGPGSNGGPPPSGFEGNGGPLRNPNGPGGLGGPPGSGGPRGSGGPGGGQNLFGHGNYIIAFLGQPSKTTPWLLQLGGHHLAFNLYYKGTTGASTPYFVGAQPNVWKDANGEVHAPLAPMRDAMHDLVVSLSPTQLTQARLNARFTDVYVGPGRDGQFPKQSEGVPVSELSDASKNLVKKAIAAWTGDAVQAEYQKLYFAELEQTKVAYSGDPSLDDTGDYVRIDGPHVWIEFACQSSNHYHTIWRDRVTDYGAEFSF